MTKLGTRAGRMMRRSMQLPAATSVLPILSLLAACSSAGGDVSGATAQAATGTQMTATFLTNIARQYVTAEGGGGGVINANRAVASGWETFTILDINGGALMSGDLVYIKALYGQYWQAANGGGSTMNAASANEMDWETFRIVRVGGSGVIANGDSIGLQTYTSGQWVSAINGGGANVVASGAALNGWEAFTIGLNGASSVAPPPSNWNLVWSDEFNGSSIDESKWSWEVQQPGWVNNELENYTYRRAENARVENGHLVIEGRHDYYNGYEYSSARLKTQGKASWTYGRVEASIQLPGGWGTWPAFWMMPDDFSRGWPACGELDIMEEVGYDQDGIHATNHSQDYNWKSGVQRTATTSVSGATTGFHTYAMEWSASQITISVDGGTYFTNNNPNTGDNGWPYDKNFYVILNLAIGGDWGGAQGVDPNTWPKQMLVDYVRVYQR